MINSLHQINTALDNLCKSLSNKEANNQMIKKSIQELLAEVKYLDDEKQKSKYYFLISQIYASRFHNIQQAVNQLQQFFESEELNTQIQMNCQFRLAFYKYFQQRYKEALKHLQKGLGYVQQERKLIQNAKFFFNRTLNKHYLIKEAKQNKNFEASFILSQIYQKQQKQMLAFQQLQPFLSKSVQPFRKFQIYKRLLNLYEIMKMNSLSIISISKKDIEKYKEQMFQLEKQSSQFIEDYHFKYQFIGKILNFLQSDNKYSKISIQKKLISLKLLAYYKLRKCSKLAPNKQIKKSLLDTASLLRNEKNTQFLELTLNYEFVNNQYKRFQIFERCALNYQLSKREIFYQIFKFQIFQPKFKKLSSKPIQYSFGSQSTSKTPTQSILKFPTQSKIPVQSKVFTQKKFTTQSKIKDSTPFVMKHTQSQVADQNYFQGSKMIKIHASSQGNEERYFYIKLDSVKEKPRLFYCNSKKEKGSNDNYYSLKGLKGIERGKCTTALKRKDTSKFEEQQCFALIFDNDKDRSFYVPNQDDYHRWIILLQTKVLYGIANISKLSNTVAFSKVASYRKVPQEQEHAIKKSRKVVQI